MITRTVYFERHATNQELSFSVEKWMLPVDGPQETILRVAVVMGNEVVLMSPMQAMAFCAAITQVAGECQD